MEIGAIDEAHDSAAAAVERAELVILCTPVGLLEEMLRQIAPAIAPGATVTDVGSTKRSVVAAGERTLPAGGHFVGSHPMAGIAKPGAALAPTHLFADSPRTSTPNLPP